MIVYCAIPKYVKGIKQAPKKRKPKTLNKIRCRKCKLPKKAEYSSSRKLTTFEIDYYAESGNHVEHSDTQESKEIFELERKTTFCDCKPILKDNSMFHEHLIKIFGCIPSKNAIKKFIRDPNYRLPK